MLLLSSHKATLETFDQTVYLKQIYIYIANRNCLHYRTRLLYNRTNPLFFFKIVRHS